MPKRRAAPRLRTVNDIAAFLAKLIRQTYREEIDASRAAKMTYMCNILQKAIEVGDIERRLEALEGKTELKEPPIPSANRPTS
jgi:hypothetical protein